MQNEILGDLGAEFGSLPEGAEEIPLDDLGTTLQGSFGGQPGKQSSSLLSKFMAAKMPGGFNAAAAKTYLETRWGLGPQRQTGALLMALSMEPAARFGNKGAAEEFLDASTAAYAAAAGFTLSSGPAASAAGAATTAIVDSAALEALSKDQKILFREQLNLFANYLQMDLKSGQKEIRELQQAHKALEEQIDLWNTEHGDMYASGITPAFSSRKARVYDSWWNWARQDALALCYDVICGRVSVDDEQLTGQLYEIANRSSPTLKQLVQHLIDRWATEGGEKYRLAKLLSTRLLEMCTSTSVAPPRFKNPIAPSAPRTTIDAQGNISFIESTREGISSLEEYVEELASSVERYESSTINHSEDLASQIREVIMLQQKTKGMSIGPDGIMDTPPLSRTLSGHDDVLTPASSAASISDLGERGMIGEAPPFVHLKRKGAQGWEYDDYGSNTYIRCLQKGSKDGLSFHGKNVLLTGAGAGSIGAEILRGLIAGGANVLVTTSRFSPEVTEYYQNLYARYGARESQLIVVPFNQGSKQDIDRLAEYIYDAKNGLGWDLDYLVPFAAIPENGREIDSIDSKSELAHRIMLTNTIRLIGSIKTQKHARGYQTRPAQVILPLSPNHGTFGNDGLYSESKLALEALFNKWHSESWGNYLTICGAAIGWTRGTGLMSGNNIVAQGVEEYGVRTFSQQEMAFNILGLMTQPIVKMCHSTPVFADLNGGFDAVPDLKGLTSQLRAEVMETSELRKSLTLEHSLQHSSVARGHHEAKVGPRANITLGFPTLPDYKTEIQPLSEKLNGMVDLERVIVVTGFAEVGPWGNARTRWAMESEGKLSLEACIELAWIMGLVKHYNGPLKGQRAHYAGWVDAKSGLPIEDKEIKTKYESYIIDHCGVRLIEPEMSFGYDPTNKDMLQEICIEKDITFEASKEAAEEFQKRHGDKAVICEIPGTDSYTVELKQGVTIWVPKSGSTDRLVGAQLPTGWDPRRYGISDDIVKQLDKATLYALVSIAESLLQSGVTDPYEFYKYVHLSEVGTAVGTSIGSPWAMRAIFKERSMEKPHPNDILQEALANTMGAWVNMLLLSSSGPINTPVGACATAVEALDIGCETILQGKAKICIVGGSDQFQEELSTEFGNMKATANSHDDVAQGRTPKEMSRPTTTTRGGFVEGEGCGTQVIMTAKLALEMGVPIYGIVALTTMASDKIGRSVPAPGQGILVNAREAPSPYPSPLLNIEYRREQLDQERDHIKLWQERQLAALHKEVSMAGTNDVAYVQDRTAHIERKAHHLLTQALNTWGNDFWKEEPRIAPLRGALATWGLTIDDLTVASLHGTSTQANDKNESDVLAKQMKHLGRKEGNAILGVFQKHLTGHPKAAAGAWMLNGGVQMFETGLVPGNRRADNVDKYLQKYGHMVYPNRSIQTDGIKAFSVTSFGFGQKGAQVIGVHPKYLYAVLDEAAYEAYRIKAEARQKKAYRYFHNALVTNTMFVAKDKAPYTPEQESQVLVQPGARVTMQKGAASFTYPTTTPVKKDVKARVEESVSAIAGQLANANNSSNTKVGVDVEEINALNIDNATFVERNFTAAEQNYCRAAPSPQSSFVGRWCAKEAVFKSLGVAGKGAGASLIDIEITNDETGSPVVTVSPITLTQSYRE